MTATPEGMCTRCGFPIVSDPAKGCIAERCACICDKYPACHCGTYDADNQIKADPFGAKAAAAAKAAQKTAAPAAVTVPGETFVLLHHVPDGKAEIVYIGGDKAKAFDKLMEHGKKNHCPIGELEIVHET